jgi:hypothetical protein
MTKTVLLLLFCSMTCLAYGQTSLDGTYIGVEEKCAVDDAGKKECYHDPARPKWKWFNLCRMKIKGDSVFLDQSPIAIYKKDTSFSASDGGFFYYSGTFTRIDTVLNIQLTELYCDYCGVPVKHMPDGTTVVVKRTKNLAGKITGAGFMINGKLFRKTNGNGFLISELRRTSN